MNSLQLFLRKQNLTIFFRVALKEQGKLQTFQNQEGISYASLNFRQRGKISQLLAHASSRVSVYIND
ncbi:hypothetical protein BKI52_30220 [marine bacterium AO1-C]|nr:hypothetical protein BKI52_30220 [marine bacterium AO1-C]